MAVGQSSYRCPTDSCWIPVIPADSGTIPVEFASQNLEILIFRYLHRNSPWNGMALECMTGMDAKNCQIWQVLHIHMKNSNKIETNRDGANYW